MSSNAAIAIRSKGFAKTLRKDRWWLYPALVLFGLISFLIYGFWSAWQADFYWYSAGQEGFGGYLAPFYSPLLFIKEGVEGAAPMAHAIFGPCRLVAELASTFSIIADLGRPGYL